jgi:hypothetical protein
MVRVIYQFFLDSGHVAAGDKFISNLPMSAWGSWMRANTPASFANEHPNLFRRILIPEFNSLSLKKIK